MTVHLSGGRIKPDTIPESALPPPVPKTVKTKPQEKIPVKPAGRVEAAPNFLTPQETKQVQEKFGSLPPVLKKALAENQSLRQQFKEINQLSQPGSGESRPPSVTHVVPNPKTIPLSLGPTVAGLGPSSPGKTQALMPSVHPESTPSFASLSAGKGPVHSPMPETGLPVQPKLQPAEGEGMGNRNVPVSPGPFNGGAGQPARPEPSVLKPSTAEIQVVGTNPRPAAPPSSTGNGAGGQVHTTKLPAPAPPFVPLADQSPGRKVSLPIVGAASHPSQAEKPNLATVPKPERNLAAEEVIQSIFSPKALTPQTTVEISKPNQTSSTVTLQSPTSAPRPVLRPEGQASPSPQELDHRNRVAFDRLLREGVIQNFVAEARQSVLLHGVQPLPPAVNIAPAPQNQVLLTNTPAGVLQPETVAQNPLRGDNNGNKNQVNPPEIKAVAPRNDNGLTVAAPVNLNDVNKQLPEPGVDQTRRLLPTNVRSDLRPVPTVNLLDLVL